MLYEDKRLAPYRGKEPFLFLSYSHKDAEQAAELILRLKQAGFRVWYDEGVIPATEWDEKIARAIKHSSYFVSLISEAYLASANCLDELNYARDLNKPQLLIFLEDVSQPEGLAMRLGRLLAVYRSRYDDPEAFYAHIFRAKGMKVCRGEPLLPAYENLEGTGSVSAETRYESAAGSYTGRLIAALVVLMLLVTALLAWNYRSEIGGLINDLRYSHVASQQNTEPASPIPEIIPDPSPMPTDNSADITVENPEPTATPAPTTATIRSTRCSATTWTGRTRFRSRCPAQRRTDGT